MQLVLIVSLFVLGVISAIGATAYVIDERAERHERLRDISDRH